MHFNTIIGDNLKQIRFFNFNDLFGLITSHL